MVFKEKNNNKGYTLVELVAVIAIMVVMVGVLSLSLSIVFNEDAQRAVALIDDELSETRMLSLSKSGDFEMIVHTTANGKDNYIEIQRDSSTYKTIRIDKDVKISSKVGVTALTSAGDDIEIAFDKSTGRVTRVHTVNGASLDNSVLEITAVAQRGNKAEAKLSLIANTGRHFIEK